MSHTELQLSAETVHEFALCDATLTGMRWKADGRDFTLDLRLGDGRASTLRCVWAVGVRVDLGSNGLGGPLSWECTWVQVEERWRMSMDFATQGAVELDCQGAVLVYDAD